jgi:hypothetical protein
MAEHTPQPGVTESESRQTTGASSNMPLAEIQQRPRHQLVHRNAASVATENIAHDGHLTIGRRARCSNNRQQHAI